MSMDEVKACFNHIWDKASYQCNLIKREIEQRHPYLTVIGGHGALDAEEHDSQGKESGAPDLFLYYGQRLVCAVEVTGSDKIIPWSIWIGKHKVEFAEKAKYPVAFFFFYGKNNEIRYFISYDEIRSVLEPPKVRTIRGLNFEYHILDVSYVKGEMEFWNWLQYCIELFQETEL